ncbi:UDP-N-acetylmuramate--L-alanine ligase [Euhalothece natronophila Z-M001]|uniref:UDP-N-acetylmuramate--L-alanine ligase n=1 Tax=Euhalothece natronophila Z-M001 TaxID=522448 RepID=A0A5B8NPH3_9CHRO|nr:UDP-N-acetylmuramate--L-alanine ligase [Euhalothece natronophila]QDZ40924.1 UDP-N-acetylmuramate--L-alanine ligase [Euhalothece natronophila Z-M001]
MSCSNLIDFKGKPFHFIGIGGIGMSALAYILAKQQLPVTGSDVGSSHITERLEGLGVPIFYSQEAQNLENLPSSSSPINSLPQVICSTAIRSENQEYQAAVAKGCPIFHRSDVLAGLVANYESVAVAGTHGKTTTSSLLGYVLLESGLDPTVVVGGEVEAWKGNARAGDSSYLVAEADESDGTLIKLNPSIGIVTNIELDHPDHYQSLDAVVEIFQAFAQKAGILVGCIDCKTVQTSLKPEITYSLDDSKKADYTVSDVNYHGKGTSATVWERGQPLGQINSTLLGSHNLSNILAVIAVARHLGLEFKVIANAIAQFSGAKRRFEVYGEENGILFVDDYAHHPSELRSTLAGAKLRLESPNFQRLVAIFQPHRYSRTEAFLAEFATAFEQADVVVVTDIYSAGETSNGLTGETLAQKIAQHHPEVIYHQDVGTIPKHLENLLSSGDIALFLGAGNLNQMIPQTMAKLATTKVA